jgi:hypothetical protein
MPPLYAISGNGGSQEADAHGRWALERAVIKAPAHDIILNAAYNAPPKA